MSLTFENSLGIPPGPRKDNGHSNSDKDPVRVKINILIKVAQLCPTFCDPIDCSPLGSSVHGISQARILD